MAEKGEKIEKDEKESKTVKGKGITFLQVLSLILILALIWIVLIVVQVPYTATNAVKEMVPTEKCVLKDMPFVSNFKTGFKYDTALKIYSSEGKALYKYSDLKEYIYANIRNTAKEEGIYCLNAQAYIIENFTNKDDSLALFENSILLNSNETQILDNWNNKYNFPVCTEDPISPINTKIISLLTPSLLSKEVQNEYNLNNVYILFTVVPPTSKECSTENVEKIGEQEVTRYCNAWKHVLGRC